MPNYLKLQLNEPTVIQLKYPTGRECTNTFNPDEKQLCWRLIDGQALYTPVSFGKTIEQLGIRAGERFTVTKQHKGRGIEWIAERITPTPIAQVLDRSENLDGHIAERKPVTQQTQLESALKTAVAAAHAAEVHAKELGYTCRFSSNDISRMGISVLISMGNSGGRYAA